MNQGAVPSPPALHSVACSYSLPPRQVCALMKRAGRKLGFDFKGVVVCNGMHPLPPDDEDWRFIRGSNEDLDFSAFMEGAEHLTLNGIQASSFLFVNDSTFTKHNAYRILKALLPYKQPLERVTTPAMAGKTDAYDNVCYANPWSGLGIYVSSFCFLLNGAAMPLLQQLKSQADLDLGPASMDITCNDWGRGLETPFREYLRTHLLHTGTSVSWYQLSHHVGNRSLLAKKARCVYFEHRLSGEIGGQGLLFSVYPRMRMKAEFFLFEQAAKLARKVRMSP